MLNYQYCFFITLIATSILPELVFAQTSIQVIPAWIKNTAKWWSDGQVGDVDYAKGIQYLIQNKIIQIPIPPTYVNPVSQVVPAWVKTTAGLWSKGQVGDSDFVKGIQYLVMSGKIQVSLSNSPNQTGNKLSQQNQITSYQSSYAIPSSCNAVAGGILPDPACTPGATDSNVTQNNIDSTICVPGYTKTVRPTVSYTEPLKFKLMVAYGYTDSASNYELDHLIPLELGGAPSDVRNLWPEPHYTKPESYNKDAFENYLHKQVCLGAMNLQTAQNEIATNWVKYWEETGRP